MPSGFHDVRFPTDISYGSRGGPEFLTEIVQLGSGAERRNQKWQYPRERWDVAYGLKTTDQMRALLEFFYARCGRLYSFRFKSPKDYQAVEQPMLMIDKLGKVFQLMKYYGSGGYSLARKITKPVVATYADGILFYEDDVGMIPANPNDPPWSIDFTTGIITFDQAHTGVMTATFEFDIHARFDVDHLPLDYSTYEAQAAAVPIVELKS